MTQIPSPFPHTQDRLLDLEVMETPRRLSRDEHRAVAGPDCSWTQAHFNEDAADD